MRERIKEVIPTLKGDPIPFRIDVVKLRGYENVYRIRIGE
jgi:mRNA-degrading endonuclease RelE of RelBE toxin-antitoxin system